MSDVFWEFKPLDAEEAIQPVAWGSWKEPGAGPRPGGGQSFAGASRRAEQQ
ncbi:MAG: hypothetical protein O2819_07035 [Planctomycetota bacterium]|nr:hypothetical protein [Planctomycetota bacterium]MDA1106043.1 hypothetical protein [Planctomycetota bacterium]